MKLLDTNILLRYVIGDGGDQASRAHKLMRFFEAGEDSGRVNALVLFEVIFMLDKHYDVSPKQIRDWIVPLFSFRGLRFDSREVFQNALELYASSKLSFVDAFNIAYMRQQDIKEIYSFDKGFDKIAGVKRLEP